MLRGIKTFVCDNCGHKFKGMDIEWNATIWSQPLKCPNCGDYLQGDLETDGRGSQSSKRPSFNF